MLTSSKISPVANGRISAKANGYSFHTDDDIWRLDKNTTVKIGSINPLLNPVASTGYRQAMAYYATNLSAWHTHNIHNYVVKMLSVTKSDTIDELTLINYRGSLPATEEYRLGTIRGFLRKWFELGYDGISEGVIELLNEWTLRGNLKGDAIKRQDPTQGPLSELELIAFNEGAVQCFEDEDCPITLSQLAYSLAISHTGRRPVQISHLRIVDILAGENQKGEPFYILNVPRGKQGDGFRSQFRPFAMSQELWAVLNAQAKDTIRQVEKILGFTVQERDRRELPLFPDMRAVAKVSSPTKLLELSLTDKLHISSAEITDTLKWIVEFAQIHSERTGELLHINARRFRYTTGTRAAREGFGELVIAELLDHSDTQNAGVYVKNIPEHVEKLDKAVGFQLAPYAQAFAGVLVDRERDAERGNDPSSRIRSEEGSAVGTCGEYGFCGAGVPVPCYTCCHFQPWLYGPHEEVYSHLLSDRERIKNITGDMQMAANLDRSITAVADVISRCAMRREQLLQERAIPDE